MQIFYAPGIEGDTYTLDEKESRHCIKVLRMTALTKVRVIDGKGNLYEGVIDNPDPKKCRIILNSVIKDFEKRDYRIHIAISPVKNPDRFEWFVEKSVEIGIDEITPLICKNTEKQKINPARLNNIIISAMKQSLKAGLTLLNEATSFEEFIKRDFRGSRLFGHCAAKGIRSKIDLKYKKGDDAVIMIGPEGDFSENEIGMAVKYGFHPVHFGTSRLRTETAGLAACYSIYFLNQ
jgi:16S rRNA (uracil1498-N3)-methyltransferase